MPVPEANSELPESTSLLDAFQKPSLAHFKVGKTLEELRKTPFENVAKAASDFFTSGVAYLANRGSDAYLQEVGTVTWWTVNQHVALAAYTDNIPAAAVQLGVPLALALRDPFPDEPHVFFGARNDNGVVTQVAFVLLTPKFVLKAQTDPIEALASIAWIGSQLRDLANGRLAIDPQNITPRAEATESHFLHGAVIQHPEVQLSDTMQTLLKVRPNGIYDPNIQAALYRGVVKGTEFRSAGNN